MAIPLQLGDVLRFTSVCRFNEQNGLNVWFARVEDLTDNGATLEECAEQVAAQWGLFVRGVMSDQADYQGLFLERIGPNPTDKYLELFENGPGTRLGDALSSQTAGLIKLTTGLPGRGFRGRKYFPFPSESDSTTEAQPGAVYINNISLIGAWFAAPKIIDGGGTNDVTIRFGLWKTAGQLFAPFVGFVARRNWATQRRRSQINRGDANII